jgi:hypothetical protein
VPTYGSLILAMALVPNVALDGVAAGAVQLDRLWPKIRSLIDPLAGVVTERILPSSGLIQSSASISASVVTSHCSATPLVTKVSGAGRRLRQVRDIGPGNDWTGACAPGRIAVVLRSCSCR